MSHSQEHSNREHSSREHSVPEGDSSIHRAVREAYGGRVANGGCGEGSPEGATAAARHVAAARKMGYSEQDTAAVPEGANLGLGCGAPLDAAAVGAGETVLDLGSGAGFDAFLAARVVGKTGRVIGVDMTPEMIDKARANAERAAVENVEFREGLIEALPVDDDSVDAVISNCVINLSPDKPAVFREAFRVLRPGGRLAVSDIVLTKLLPQAVADNLAAYVGCLAGAALIDDYLNAIRDAGFEEPRVETRRATDVLSCDDPVVRAATDAVASCCGSGSGGGHELDPDDIADTIVSATVVAQKT